MEMYLHEYWLHFFDWSSYIPVSSLGMENKIIKLSQIPEDGIIFYDIETGPPDPLPEGVADAVKGAVSAVYCRLHMKACQVGIDSDPEIVETEEQEDRFRKLLLDPKIIKVSYNGINFDDIVLWREGYFVEPTNRHDMYLGLKTVAPTLKSYSLKFANAYYFQDFHFPERKLWAWLKRHNYNEQMHKAPKRLLAEYCMHDVRQTRNVFCAIWDRLQQPLHWKAYKGLELAMAEPLHEMILGGEWLEPDSIAARIEELEQEFNTWVIRARKWSNEQVSNPLSSQEVTAYGVANGIEFELSEKGHLIARKADVLRVARGDKELRGRLVKRNRQGGRGELDVALEEDVFESKVNWEDMDKLAYHELTQKERVVLTFEAVYGARDVSKTLGYYRSYLNASRYEQQQSGGNGDNSKRGNSRLCPSHFRGCFQERRYRVKSPLSKNSQGDNQTKELIKIPKAYSLSAARTRRLLSSSMFGINFQNQNKNSKVVQLVPPGWLGVWIDSTQIENVVHIWASNDDDRRQAYEADVNWSEYVWLCNRVLGGKERDRKTLEGIDSPVNPAWSVYKQFKTIKLALNFGMGPDKFSATTGLTKVIAKEMFEQVHEACPAIRQLQNLIRDRLDRDNFIRDNFGHIYSGPIKEAYKVVSYLIQGMGTGSFPKAMTIANYETLHSLDTFVPRHFPHIRHSVKELYSYGILTGTTHDECAFRLSLGLPPKVIIKVVRDCLYNMEERFSDKVGGIPLRAKIAFSITNAAKQEEMDHRAEDFEEKLLEKYIYAGKKKAGVRTS
jgi:hypothetical protein